MAKNMIKKVLIVIIVLFGFNTINAQTLKYHKVLMQGDENLAKRLLELGITIDHSDVQGNDIAACAILKMLQIVLCLLQFAMHLI